MLKKPKDLMSYGEALKVLKSSLQDRKEYGAGNRGQIMRALYIVMSMPRANNVSKELLLEALRFMMEEYDELEKEIDQID